MVAAHVAWLHSEAEMMIENERRKDLSLLYPLLRPLPSGLAPLIRKLTEHITQQGLQAVGSLQGDNVSICVALWRLYITHVGNLLPQAFLRVSVTDSSFTPPGTHPIRRKHAGRAHQIL